MIDLWLVKMTVVQPVLGNFMKIYSYFLHQS